MMHPRSSSRGCNTSASVTVTVTVSENLTSAISLAALRQRFQFLCPSVSTVSG